MGTLMNFAFIFVCLRLFALAHAKRAMISFEVSLCSCNLYTGFFFFVNVLKSQRTGKFAVIVLKALPFVRFKFSRGYFQWSAAVPF